ncbi:MAG: hypothetical protein L0196_04725, partial [candidate division Zixibacteria bacterium]|nr:hypothetical protein [candidate division Zixibacteria bacterium]
PTRNLPDLNRHRRCLHLTSLTNYTCPNLKWGTAVGTTALVKGVNQSGYQVDRLDRILEPFRKDGLVIRAGKKKGTTYQLTNKGEIRAKEIMDNLLSILT